MDFVVANEDGKGQFMTEAGQPTLNRYCIARETINESSDSH